MINEKSIHALLPMKAHSERVPNKNIKIFNGKPLYHHVLLMLIGIEAIDAVIINTDSDRIAHEAASLSPKVRIVRRPAELLGDFVSMNKIIAHDIAAHPADIFLQTHSTNPCLRAESTAGAIARFAGQRSHDSLFTVNRYQSRFYRQDGSPVNHDPENLLRTQDLPPLFEENSCLFLFTAASFAAKGRRIGECPMMHETPWVESADIDTHESWRLAEILHKNIESLVKP